MLELISSNPTISYSNSAAVLVVLFVLVLILLQDYFDPLKVSKKTESSTPPAEEKELKDNSCALCEKMKKIHVSVFGSREWVCPECGQYKIVPIAGIVLYNTGDLDKRIAEAEKIK